MNTKNDGFTLIELMIVIAIIAVVAAIAVPALTKSTIVANEKSAIGSLKSIREMNAMFKTSDDDRNTINDYWTYDVSGLYRVLNASGSEIKKIEVPIASADMSPIAAVPNYVGSAFALTAPKAGYYFQAMTTDEEGSIYRINAIYGTTTYALHNSKFAFCAFPETYEQTGRNIYIVNQSGTIWKKDIGSNSSVLTWPSDNPKNQQWGSIDF